VVCRDRNLWLIICILICLPAAGIFAQGLGPPVEIRIPVPPTPAKANNQTILAYELHLTNFLPSEITLNQVDVFGQDVVGSPLASYREANLANAIVQPAARTVPDRRKIGGGMRAVIYMWVALDKGRSVPHSLRHKLSVTFSRNEGRVEEATLDIPGPEVAQAAPIVVAPPFKAGLWYAGNGPSNTSIHRRALLLSEGQARIAQRYAIDWLKVNDDGKLFHDDPKANANWYDYGTEVIAVADAVVAAVKDGIPENVPLSTYRAVSITPETVGGNYVALTLGNNRYALYAHLQPGSMRVKPGEHVRRGQVLGLLGNSGNSDAPHLHFQISTAPSFVAAEGLPYVFDSFVVHGMADISDAVEHGWKASAEVKPEKHLREIPTENVVVRFE
jgi:murein DD-endopeptidase MepM/ murein hydrolase activator NlpD